MTKVSSMIVYCITVSTLPLFLLTVKLHWWMHWQGPPHKVLLRPPRGQLFNSNLIRFLPLDWIKSWKWIWSQNTILVLIWIKILSLCCLKHFSKIGIHLFQKKKKGLFWSRFLNNWPQKSRTVTVDMYCKNCQSV